MSLQQKCVISGPNYASPKNDDNDEEKYDRESAVPRKYRRKNGAKAMAEAEKISKIDPAEVEILIERVKQNKLDERETELIAGLLRTCCI